MNVVTVWRKFLKNTHFIIVVLFLLFSGCLASTGKMEDVENKLATMKELVASQIEENGIEGAFFIEGIPFKFLSCGCIAQGYIEFDSDQNYHIKYFSAQEGSSFQGGFDSAKGVSAHVADFVTAVLKADNKDVDDLEIMGVYWRVQGDSSFTGFLSLGLRGVARELSSNSQLKLITDSSAEILGGIRFIKEIIDKKLKSQGCVEDFRLYRIQFSIIHSRLIKHGSITVQNGRPINIEISSSGIGSLANPSVLAEGRYLIIIQFLMSVLKMEGIPFDDVELDRISWLFENGMGEMSIDVNGNIIRFSFYDGKGNIFMEKDGVSR